MRNLKQFSNIIDVLKNMPVDKKMALINAHKEFHRLKLLCEIKKEIEVMPGLSGVRVLKNTDNTKALKKLVDQLNPGGFKWEPKTKRKLDTQSIL